MNPVKDYGHNPIPGWPKGWHDQDCGDPVLVLATTSFERLVPKEPEKWAILEHQCEGHACGQLRVMALRLEPKPDVLVAMKAIEEHYYDQQTGVWGVSLPELVAYDAMVLDLLGPDCRAQSPQSIKHFCEAVYPIDLTPAAIQRLTDDVLPKDPDDLMRWGEHSFDKFCGIFGRWNLFILGANSD